MVISGLPVTLATGPRACGKSTILEIIHMLANCETVIFGDTSSIIDLHIERRTPVGLKLEEYRKDRASGKIIRNDELVLEAIKQWIACKASKREVKHVLLGGCPRSIAQSIFWKNTSNESRVLHITVKDYDEMKACVNSRINDGVFRQDDQDELALKNAWKDYNESVVPGLKVFNGHVLVLPRSESLLTKTEKAIAHISVPVHVKHKLLNRLHTRDHPGRVEIEKIMGKKKK